MKRFDVGVRFPVDRNALEEEMLHRCVSNIYCISGKDQSLVMAHEITRSNVSIDTTTASRWLGCPCCLLLLSRRVLSLTLIVNTATIQRTGIVVFHNSRYAHSRSIMCDFKSSTILLPTTTGEPNRKRILSGGTSEAHVLRWSSWERKSSSWQ